MDRNQYAREWRQLRKSRHLAGKTEIPKKKRCPRCGETKGAAEFTRNLNHSDGLATWCKPCCSQEQQERARRNRALIRSTKEQPCMDCGRRYPYYVMDLDHRDGSTKVDKLSAMVSLRTERVLAELAKCDVVCANCHRERTARRADWTA